MTDDQIARLRARIAKLDKDRDDWKDEFFKSYYRIAELEAALRKFDFYLILDSDKDTDTLPVLIEHIRAARAALGEKE